MHARLHIDEVYKTAFLLLYHTHVLVHFCAFLVTNYQDINKASTKTGHRPLSIVDLHGSHEFQCRFKKHYFVRLQGF